MARRSQACQRSVVGLPYSPRFLLASGRSALAVNIDEKDLAQLPTKSGRSAKLRVAVQSETNSPWGGGGQRTIGGEQPSCRGARGCPKSNTVVGFPDNLASFTPWFTAVSTSRARVLPRRPVPAGAGGKKRGLSCVFFVRGGDWFKNTKTRSCALVDPHSQSRDSADRTAVCHHRNPSVRGGGTQTALSIESREPRVRRRACSLVIYCLAGACPTAPTAQRPFQPLSRATS